MAEPIDIAAAFKATEPKTGDELADAGLDPKETDTEATVPPVNDVPDQRPEEAMEVLTTECAFLVYINRDGHWVADSKALGVPVASGREATFGDFYAACAVIQHDVTIAEQAGATVAAQQQVAAAMQQQMQQQAVAQQLAREGKMPGGASGIPDLSKLAGNRQQRRHPG
jgi:hypothetical protein